MTNTQRIDTPNHSRFDKLITVRIDISDLSDELVEQLLNELTEANISNNFWLKRIGDFIRREE